MDTGTGCLTPISEERANQIEAAFDAYAKNDVKESIKKEASGIFREGEIVSVKGSIFRITNISRRKLTLTIISPSEKESLRLKTLSDATKEM